MAYTPNTNSFRVVSITHGAAPIPDPIGGSIDESVGWSETRPGTRISPAVALDSYGIDAVGKGTQRFTPIVRGTSATLTFTILDYVGSASGTVAVATMLAGDYHANFDSKPHVHSQHFKFNAGNTENFAAVSQT